MRDNGYSMSSTAFTHEDREDEQLVSIDDLCQDRFGMDYSEYEDEQFGAGGFWDGHFYNNEGAHRAGFDSWETQIDFERRMEKE
jgi:hypothetical protein